MNKQGILLEAAKKIDDGWCQNAMMRDAEGNVLDCVDTLSPAWPRCGAWRAR